MASIAAPPTGIAVSVILKPNFDSTTLNTLRASVITSGPMPSPASTAMRWVLLMGISKIGVVKRKSSSRTTRLAAVGWNVRGIVF